MWGERNKTNKRRGCVAVGVCSSCLQPERSLLSMGELLQRHCCCCCSAARLSVAPRLLSSSAAAAQPITSARPPAVTLKTCARRPAHLSAAQPITAPDGTFKLRPFSLSRRLGGDCDNQGFRTQIHSEPFFLMDPNKF